MFKVVLMKIKIFPKFLAMFLLVAIVPVVILTFTTIRSGTEGIKKEVERGLVFRATDIAEQVSNLLYNVTGDLKVLTVLPRNTEAYADFSVAKVSEIWTRAGSNDKPVEVITKVPLYRELAFIDVDGNERIKIENTLDEFGLPTGHYNIVTKKDTALTNVKDPKNTLYKTEDYFSRALSLPKGEIYVGHLTGLFVNADEQLKGKQYPEEAIEGKRYSGIVRFAAPVYNDNGVLEGVVTLALDQAHLQERIIHIDPLQSTRLAFAPYATGNYIFLFDDEAWIIAHAKLWDIKGMDANGAEVGPFKNVVGTNSGPVNLIRGPETEAHAKLEKLMDDIWVKKGGVFDVPNIGAGIAGPTVRAQAYAPIVFSAGDYEGKGVFGGVMVGAKLSSVKLIAESMMNNLYITLLAIVIAVLFVSIIVVRSLTGRIRVLTDASREIAEGDLDKKVPSLGSDEVGDLGVRFNSMAESLKGKLAEVEENKERQVELQRRLAEKEKKERINLRSRLDILEKELAEKPFEGIICESQGMKKILAGLGGIASTDATVMVLGERGTGKEVIAANIHSLSERRARAYLRVNCGAIAEQLIESELFGHAKGAYTGAHKERPGFFEAASGGTLLLDEIGELSLNVQVKLLRVLQERTITRMGETRERKIDVRLIVASNRDLSQMVKVGTFRADLYDRLNVVAINIPPLRERKEDIIPLARYFLQKAAARHDKNILGISESAVDAMMAYSWPGNVRELGNAMERAVIRAAENYIEKEDMVLDGETETPFSEYALPDMTIEELKIEYSKHLKSKYPSKTLGEIKEILKVDWNTLRKYLAS